MYYFPPAAVTEYHKFSDLEEPTRLVYSSQGQKSKIGLAGLKSKFGRAVVLLEVLRRIRSLHPPAPGGLSRFLACGCITPTSALVIMSPLTPLLLPLLRTLVITLGPPGESGNSLVISATLT